ncbi:EAL domain-containing protein [Gammaproteobacteria bacterium AS21]
MNVDLALKNSLIMMIDDEPIMLELIQIFLEDAGYQNFCGISDATTALQEISRKEPDIILLDIVMPKVDGYEILAELRASEKTKHLPVIILTSSTDSASKLKALALGATDFLAKPVDQSELALRVRNTLTFKAYQDRLAYFDPLTGLPNKKLYLKRISKAITSFKDKSEHLSILNVRLGEYRKLTQGLGPKISESILKSVSERLLDCVRSSDVISNSGSQDPTRITAHIAGDEFSVLLSRIQNVGDASYVAERFIAAFKKPLIVEGRSLFLSLYIGISVYPNDGSDSDDLLSKASSVADSLVGIKEDGYQFYSSEANKHLKEKIDLQQDLRVAISNSEFGLVYQPQVDANTFAVKGAEALLRWHHPIKGFISPNIFIPIAEENDLMIDIGNRVLLEACKHSVLLRNHGLDDIMISINISGRQFRSPTFLDVIKAALLETGACASAIMFEITESLAMADIHKTTEILHLIRALGIKVSVDDFGTGYSSLSYLKEFPIDELKIDKAFIDGLPANNGDQAITSAIVTMSKKLNFQVVAEGVEFKAQLDYLQKIGCDLIQGYLFSKPLSQEDFIEFCQHKITID